ncbi:MAG TPA: disulfide bond formation protein B, partial [Candidatus Dormibacteraeota bacterium]|nr:disulfide bond formation protein B [Candidatus Dormibacteraeota bacterium]
ALAVAADAAVLLIVGAVAGAAVSPGLRGRVDRAREALSPLLLGLAWCVAAIATSGSLYFSQGAGLVPCTLCWYQRIAMYPLVLVLGVAVVRGDLAVRPYAMPLAGAGAVISAYHYQLERFPSQGSFSCTVDVPCSVTLFTRLGFVSIPWMALSGFALVLALLGVARPPGWIEAEAGETDAGGGDEDGGGVAR